MAVQEEGERRGKGRSKQRGESKQKGGETGEGRRGVREPLE